MSSIHRPTGRVFKSLLRMGVIAEWLWHMLLDSTKRTLRTGTDI